jgi:cytochrome o ubiquinol oxidase subunit II
MWHLFDVLNPYGPVALAERGLMVAALLFMLIVAIPVLGLLFFFAWRYRASNTKAAYTPNWRHGKLEELVWWAIPLEIILILGAITWTSTHELDPRKGISTEPPLVVQVVALDWKWLFIYPEQGVATVNYLALPVGKPVKFEVTADAPMNSFWIPQLSGQIYAMTGMVNELNVLADKPGTFKGMSANYSGEGFAHMRFTAEAMSQEEFVGWIAFVHQDPDLLDLPAYQNLAAPAVLPDPVYYGQVAPGMLSQIVSKFAGVTDPSSH